MQKFHVSDVVDVTERDLVVYGVISELLPDNKVTVHFKEPRYPKKCGICDACHWPGYLSMNAGTGEMVCMRSGCGHEHGFEERDEIISISKLRNISEERGEEKKKDFSVRLSTLISEGVDKGILTSDQKEKILQII